MSHFKIVDHESQIIIAGDWVKCSSKSLGKITDQKGHVVHSNYQGRRYEIAEKTERSFSSQERFKRKLVGVLLAICTLCFGLFSKSVRNLFTKHKESVRFG